MRRLPVKETVPIVSGETSHEAQAAPERAITILAVGSPTGGEGQALLATALRNHFGEVRTARALLDPGSEVSLVTESLAQRLRLPRRRAVVAVIGLGGSVFGFSRERTILELITKERAIIYVPALIFPKLSDYGEGLGQEGPDCAELRDLDLADPEFGSAGSVEVLLGARTCASILRPGIRHAGGGEFVAQETSLGWVVYGIMRGGERNKLRSSFHCRADHDLANLVERFWSQEEAPNPGAVLNAEESDCEDPRHRVPSPQVSGEQIPAPSPTATTLL